MYKKESVYSYHKLKKKFFMVFSETHVWISQRQQQWEIIYTHGCKSYSEEVKHIAVN